MEWQEQPHGRDSHVPPSLSPGEESHTVRYGMGRGTGQCPALPLRRQALVTVCKGKSLAV